MPETDWFPGGALPDRQGYFEWSSPPAKPRSRATACWDGSPRNRAAASRWRGLDPEIEAAEIARAQAVRQGGDAAILLESGRQSRPAARTAGGPAPMAPV